MHLKPRERYWSNWAFDLLCLRSHLDDTSAAWMFSCRTHRELIPSEGNRSHGRTLFSRSLNPSGFPEPTCILSLSIYLGIFWSKPVLFSDHEDSCLAPAPTCSEPLAHHRLPAYSLSSAHSTSSTPYSETSNGMSSPAASNCSEGMIPACSQTAQG